MEPITIRKVSYPTPRCPTCGVRNEPVIKRTTEGDKVVCTACGKWSVMFIMPNADDIMGKDEDGNFIECVGEEGKAKAMKILLDYVVRDIRAPKCS